MLTVDPVTVDPWEEKPENSRSSYVGGSGFPGATCCKSAGKRLFPVQLNLQIHPDPAQATSAAADWLTGRLILPNTRTLMVAGGNTPLPLYAEVARRGPSLSHLTVFALDEYVGVPPKDPRTCANLLRRTVVEAWNIPATQYFHLSSLEEPARQEIQAYEKRIVSAGGLDVIILGLGRNGHLGYNEPGSEPDSPGRVVNLERGSVEANRGWFGGDHAPDKGVTVGLKTILSSKAVLILAFGSAKADAAHGMVKGPIQSGCPASFLRNHPEVHVFLDEQSSRATP